MEALIELLLTLISKVPFLSEQERAAATEKLRTFAEAIGKAEAVPPAPSDQPTPVAAPEPVEAPAPVAEPVPADEQTPPPISPEVAPEHNAFADAADDDVPGSP
jgi:hypothetical protein